MKHTVWHNGVIESIDDGHIKVKIVQTSACASCKVAAQCHASDRKEKMIDVYQVNGESYRVGEEVKVVASASTGMNAVVIAFVIPFVIMVAAVFVSTLLSDDELIAAMAGVVSLTPYYICLFLLRDRIGKRLAFTLEKVMNN
jgi:sigma-E factor negative regulatory protein RseC